MCPMNLYAKDRGPGDDARKTQPMHHAYVSAAMPVV